MKNYQHVLPQKISLLVGAKPYEVVNVGLSGASVLLYPNCVLKIQSHSEQSVNEVKFMRYLKGKILAPEVVEYETQNGVDYLLMSRLCGEMLTADKFLSNQTLLFEKVKEVLYTLRRLPSQDCPCDMTLERKLRLAQNNVQSNSVDMNNVNPLLLGKNGRFKSPEKLLQWLVDNKPNEDLKITHGDFCLPNIIACDKATGIIDFPYGGVADSFCDIALVMRSIKSNLGGEYGGKVYGEFNEKLFFDILNISPDYDKINYYVLLDELF